MVSNDDDYTSNLREVLKPSAKYTQVLRTILFNVCVCVLLRNHSTHYHKLIIFILVLCSIKFYVCVCAWVYKNLIIMLDIRQLPLIHTVRILKITKTQKKKMPFLIKKEKIWFIHLLLFFCFFFSFLSGDMFIIYHKQRKTISLGCLL